MAHRQLAEDYRQQVVAKQKLLDERDSTIFELRGAVADRDDQLKQRDDQLKQRDDQLKQHDGGHAVLNAAQARIKELEDQLAATIDQQSNDVNPKIEAEEASAQQQLDDWGTYMHGVTQRTGIAADGFEEEFSRLKAKFECEQDTCNHRGETIKNLERKLNVANGKLEKQLVRMQKQVETAQKETKKVERELWSANDLSVANPSKVPGHASPSPVSTTAPKLNTVTASRNALSGSPNATSPATQRRPINQTGTAALVNRTTTNGPNGSTFDRAFPTRTLGTGPPKVPVSPRRAPALTTPTSTPKRKASEMYGSKNGQDQDDEETIAVTPSKIAKKTVVLRQPPIPSTKGVQKGSK